MKKQWKLCVHTSSVASMTLMHTIGNSIGQWPSMRWWVEQIFGINKLERQRKEKHRIEYRFVPCEKFPAWPYIYITSCKLTTYYEIGVNLPVDLQLARKTMMKKICSLKLCHFVVDGTWNAKIFIRDAFPYARTVPCHVTAYSVFNQIDIVFWSISEQ